MDRTITKTTWKTLLLRLPGRDAAPPAADAPGSGGQDRILARRPLWLRRAPIAIVMVIAAAGAVGLMMSGKRGSVYRAPLGQLTLATVREGPFEDYVAVRGAAAPLVTASDPCAGPAGARYRRGFCPAGA